MVNQLPMLLSESVYSMWKQVTGYDDFTHTYQFFSQTEMRR